MSKEARKLVKKYGAWGIQFPRFTYIQVQGFSSYPYRLPKYPTNKMVLLEVTRQLAAYDKIQKKKGGLEFPIVMGDYDELCPSLATMENSTKEPLFYHLTPHIARSDFDPNDKIRMVVGMRHMHRIWLEDYCANAKDDYKIRKIMFSKLPLKMIRICEIIQLPNQVEEDVNTVHPNYEKKKIS